MSSKLADVLAAAESLSAAERRELIDLLAAGLGDPSLTAEENGAPTLSEAWRKEIARRSAEFDAGQCANGDLAGSASAVANTEG